MMNLPDRIRVFGGKDNRVNAVIVLGKSGTAVVDTLVTLDDGRALKQLADELSAGKPIVAVALTHEHFDHIAGNQFFACNIISSEEARNDIVASREQLNKRIAGLSLAPPNVSYSERCDLSLGDLTLAMKHEGGHCPGESSILIPELGTLMAGDLVFNGRTPFVATADIPRWVTALTRLHAMDPEIVIPGHGEPGTKQLLIEQRNWLEGFMDAVVSSKRQGLSAGEATNGIMASLNLSQDRRQMIFSAVDRLYGDRSDDSQIGDH